MPEHGAEAQPQQEVGLEQLLTGLAAQIAASVNKRQIPANIPIFGGDVSAFCVWIQSLEKYVFIAELHVNQTVLLAYQYSKGAPSDYIARYIKDNHDGGTWQQLKEQLTVRFSPVADSRMAFSMLMGIKQYPTENVQSFAERLINLGDGAFQVDERNLAPVQRQLINFFIDGLRLDSLKMKILRSCPTDLTAAINLAIEEQNLIARFGMRKREMPSHSVSEPMDVSHSREFRNFRGDRGPKLFCQYCKRTNHNSRDCRSRKHIRTIEIKRQERNLQNVQCWFCNLYGHFSRDCAKRKRNQENLN